MIFNPQDVLTFNYEKDTHLTTYLFFKNNTNAPIGFKVKSYHIQFKVSTTNKFIINPNVGMIKPFA
jgi:hypothetical protein